MLLISTDEREELEWQYLSDWTTLLIIAADGRGTPRELTSGANLAVGAWSEDGVLVFQQGLDLWTVNVDGIDGPRPFLETPDIREAHPVLSPDGRWLAYSSDEAGTLDV